MTDKVYAIGLVLNRTDFSEADRIITILTPDQGKIRLIAKGVRKPTSKLAGGIELFSEVEIGYVRGRGDLATLVSSRLVKFYRNILSDIDKVQLMYKVLKTLDNITEDDPGSEYYTFLIKLMILADNPKISSTVLNLYFKAQLLKLSGHQPNLITDSDDDQLKEKGSYTFNFSSMCMVKTKNGQIKAPQIKFLRLLFSDSDKVFNVTDADSISLSLKPMLDAMMKQTLSI